MDTPAQIKAARNALRSAIFDLVRGKLLRDSIGLQLLRVVEYTLRDKDEEGASIDVPHGMHIVDESGDGTTWRAYPAEESTIEELLRACQAFPVRPWVDLDSRICLISVEGPGAQLPDALMLCEAMYGLGDMVELTPPAMILDEPAIEFEGGEKPFDRFTGDKS